MRCVLCHEKILAVDDERVLTIFDEEKFPVHVYCGLVIEKDIAHLTKEKEKSFIRKILTAVSMCLIFSVKIFAEEGVNDQKEWVKGAVVIGVSSSGNCVFKPFVKVADTENNADDDSAQILGYTPGNVQVDRYGKIVWERISDAQFIPLRQMKTIHGRACRCPQYNE